MNSFIRKLVETPSTTRGVALHCVGHSLFSACPSFLFAIATFWSSPEQLVGMITGVLTFAAIATFAHLSPLAYSVSRNPSAARALRFAKGLRIFQIVILTLALLALTDSENSLAVLSTVSLTVSPDFFAGSIATGVTSQLGLASPVTPYFHPNASPLSSPSSDTHLLASFSQAFVATMIEGILLAFLMLIIAFLAFLVLRLISRPAFSSPDKVQ